MKLHKKILCIAGVGLLLTSTSLFATEKSAQNIINNAYKYIGGMDKYTFTAIITEEDANNGKIVRDYKHNISVKVDRPNMLRMETKGDLKNRTNYINNGLFTMMDHTSNFYGQIKTPRSINGTLDMLFKKYSINAPLAQLIYSDMNKRVKFKKSKYFGTTTLNGVECDYVAFKTKQKEVHVWIATGDKPLVQNYSIIDTNINGNPRMNTTLVWNNNSKISNSDFIFAAPKNASKILVNKTN